MKTQAKLLHELKELANHLLAEGNVSAYLKTLFLFNSIRENREAIL